MSPSAPTARVVRWQFLTLMITVREFPPFRLFPFLGLGPCSLNQGPFALYGLDGVVRILSQRAAPWRVGKNFGPGNFPDPKRAGNYWPRRGSE